MKHDNRTSWCWKVALLCGIFVIGVVGEAERHVLTGAAAFTDYKQEQPGVFRRITVTDLPKPFATQSVTNHPKLISRPEGVIPRCLPGFQVSLYAEKLEAPRYIKAAPNGDFFVSEATAEEGVNKVLVFRGI